MYTSILETDFHVYSNVFSFVINGGFNYLKLEWKKIELDFILILNICIIFCTLIFYRFITNNENKIAFQKTEVGHFFFLFGNNY